MKTEKRNTETYVLTNLDRLDPVTVYVTNYETGKGKIVIECFGKAWSCYWPGMGNCNLQQFLLGCENDYILGRMLENTRQTDFNEVNDIAHKNGSLLCVTNDAEIAMAAEEMARIFGDDWYMDLPQRNTSEYDYLGRILNAVKGAFHTEMKQAP